jgi:putative acetyltransferase
MVTIRASRSEEGALLVEIWCASVDATHHFLSAEDRAAIEAEVRDFLPEAPALVAVDRDDRPVAFTILDGTHMQALFVHPAARGSGVGRALVEHALALHPGLSTDVNEQNAQALGFYWRMGFAPTGRSETDGQGRAYPLIHLAVAR